MKKLLLVALMLSAASARAQQSAAPVDKVVQDALQETIVGLEQVVAVGSLDLYPIGKPFGSSHQWQAGIDKSRTMGACIQREDHDGQWLGGPCRDVLLLARNGVPMFHAGIYAMFNAEHGNGSFGLRAGINVIPMGKAGIQKAAQYLPYIEALAEWEPPRFLHYLDQISTIDYGIGYRPVHDASVNGHLTRGVMAMVNIPIADIGAVLKLGL